MAFIPPYYLESSPPKSSSSSSPSSSPSSTPLSSLSSLSSSSSLSSPSTLGLRLVLVLSFCLQSLSLDICPGVIDCAHDAVDVMVSFEDKERGHVAGARDAAACQQFCRDTKHTYYRFVHKPVPRKGLCACFDGCAALVPGNHTVGLVDACMASPLLRLRAQQQQELGDWEQQGVHSSATQNQKSGAYAKPLGEGQQKEMVEKMEEEEEVMGGILKGQPDLQRLQQKKQIERQKGPGWQALQMQQLVLKLVQQRFLEQEETVLSLQQKSKPAAKGLFRGPQRAVQDQASEDDIATGLLGR